MERLLAFPPAAGGTLLGKVVHTSKVCSLPQGETQAAELLGNQGSKALWVFSPYLTS